MAERDLSQSATYNARPTVRIADQDNQAVTNGLLTMRILESEGGLSSMELRLRNFANSGNGPALTFENEQDVKLGSDIAIYTGDVQSPQEIFRGVVTGLEADFPDGQPPELVLLAEDKLQLARQARRSKTYDHFKISDLANQVAQELSLTPKVTGLTDDLGTQVQLNESDLAFLRRMLERYDGDLQVVGKELHVSKRSDVQRGTVELELYSQLKRVRVTADLAHQLTAMTVAGWDESQGQKVTGSSSGSHAGPGSGRTGAQLLQDSIGERSEHLAHLAASTSDEAQAIADAAFDRLSRRFVTIDGTAEGNAQLRVGTTVTIKGVSDRFNNDYYVTRVVHRFDEKGGYVSDFEAESSYLGNP